MKFAIPEISWHNRDPVLSVDFQPKAAAGEPLRLATGGTDSHVLIWYISTTETGSVNLEVAADLTRHQKAVNVVRWSPNGQYLASGDDESIIFVWKQKTEEIAPVLDQMEEQYKETWVIHKTLRGHMEDVLDISWSANSLHLASGSVDNKLLMWDLSRGRYSCILTDHKGFVQGVSWDPKGQLIASASSDRVFRTFDIRTKKVASRSGKAALPFPPGHSLSGVKLRLYHDDTLQTYFRRLQFSPDGTLLAVPAGRAEPDQPLQAPAKPLDAVYIYTRYSLKVPACVLPTGEAALVCRWLPRVLSLRSGGPRTAVPLRSGGRMVLAVGTRRCVLLYDTQQTAPVALISNIHYTRLTDLTWSPDGRKLVASSTDGYCSVITFAEGELGDVLPDNDTADHTTVPEPMDIEESPRETTEKPEERKETKPISTMDPFIKFKTPEKSPKKQKIVPQQKTPVKIDVLEEVAMPSWSDNSNNEIIKPKPIIDPNEIMIIEDSEDMKLVYEDTQPIKSANQSPDSPKSTQNAKGSKTDGSPKTTLIKDSRISSSVSENDFFRQAKVTDVKEAAVKAAPNPKAPRRVSFVTLSSPKNSKKKC